MNIVLDWKEYAKTARQAAADGCVLLRNENHALPIRKGEAVSVFGRIQFDYYKSGTGSGGMVNAPYVVSILEGLQASGEIRINEELLREYRVWTEKNPYDTGAGWAKEPWSQKEMLLNEDMVKKAAEASDIAVIILGRTAGEDMDNSGERGSYLLTEEEEALLEQVCNVFSRTAVVLNTGNIIDMKWVERCRPQAVLYAWQGGMEGGNAVADILTGAVNPSGKLSDTIAYDISDYPSTAHFGDAVRNFYEEDIYVGYRYFETFAKDKVLYPFGFGLSYTQFSLNTEQFAEQEGTVNVSITVTNIGNVSGRETVQLYACPPQGKLGKALRNLARFHKTGLLLPGQSEEVSFVLPLREIASYDDGGAAGKKSCYILEPGKYAFFAGTDVRSAQFVGDIQVDELTVTQKWSEAIAPVIPFERIKPQMREDGSCTQTKEAVPMRTIDLSDKILKNRPDSEEYTGNLGYKLADVYKGKVSQEQFLVQLTNEDLICMTRGEGMSSPKVTPGTASAFGGVTDRLQQFGIPVGCCSDGPSGIRMDCGSRAFSLPNGTALACTFDPQLLERLYEFEGMELRRNQVDTLLGPGMNIHRNPLNGRNFEYFSEDPYLTGKMAAAELRGMAKYGVTGTIKHFACNNQEYKRHDSDSVVSERALREIYLKGFEIAVKEGGAYSVMSTYGALNGIWTAGNFDLLTTILRKEWGFDGLVMTDWWAKMNEEGEDGRMDNTIPMVRAQNDVYMVVADAKSNSAGDNSESGLQEGRITRGELLRNAANICKVLMRSPVMKRFLGEKEDEITEQNVVQWEEENDRIHQKAVVTDQTVLNTEGVSTAKGSSLQYALQIPEKGDYRIRFRLASDAGRLAQMPMTVFLNNQIVKTITINGTNGSFQEETAEFSVFAAIDNYLKLYFGESGITIGEIRIEKK